MAWSKIINNIIEGLGRKTQLFYMNAKENTFRILQGTPLLMSSAWCLIGIHKWTKWSEIVKRNKPGYDFLFEHIQERYCANCNRYDKKKV